MSLYKRSKQAKKMLICLIVNVFLISNIPLSFAESQTSYHSRISTLSPSVHIENAPLRNIFSQDLQGLLSLSAKNLNSTLWAEKTSGQLVSIPFLRSNDDFGMGDIADAYVYVDFLAQIMQKIWQILPLNETKARFGDPSPYNCISAFAKEPLLISIKLMKDLEYSEEAKKLIEQFEEAGILETLRKAEEIDYEAVAKVKYPIFRLVFRSFLAKEFNNNTDRAKKFKAFLKRKAYWIDDYGLFRAYAEISGTLDWSKWEQGMQQRSPEAMDEQKKKLREEILFYQYLQFVFDEQWMEFVDYSKSKGVELSMIDDIPFYVAKASADTWAHRELFELDNDGQLRYSSGAEPDAYAPVDGQYWGHAPYIMSKFKETNYEWMIRRFLEDIPWRGGLRIDHVRAFFNFWKINVGQKGNTGWYEEGPQELLHIIQNMIAYTNYRVLIGEDLGSLADEVFEYLDRVGLYGMKIFEFGWGPGSAVQYSYPQNYPELTLAAPGTHDNPTLRGWWREGHTKESPMLPEHRRTLLNNLFGEGSFDIKGKRPAGCLGFH